MVQGRPGLVPARGARECGEEKFLDQLRVAFVRRGECLNPTALELGEQCGVGHDEECLSERRRFWPLAVAHGGPLGTTEDTERPGKVRRRYAVGGNLDGEASFRGVATEIAG